jgi:hypothetical protein
VERESRGVKRSIFRAVALHKRALNQVGEETPGATPTAEDL